jgi:NAD+ kinase
MNIAIYGRPVSTTQVAFAVSVLNTLHVKGSRVWVHKKYLDFLKSKASELSDYDDTILSTVEIFETSEDLSGKVDFLFSIGGDGTLLDTILLVKPQTSNNKPETIPIVGVNAGRLGFLSSVAKENVAAAVDMLAKGHYSTDSRTLLRLDSNHPLFEGESIALNDLTIHKKETASMITIHTYLNGEYLNSYWADGLIIATPTGSTGYSLSCGGPILVPQSESFVITPIAPHNLNVRPIIVSDKNIITLEVEGRPDHTGHTGHHFMATLDSRSATIDSGFQLAIRRESFCINLVRLNNENFLTTLRNKLNWGLDKRN